MKFTYKPEGGDERSWTFKPAKMPNVEAEYIEDLTGWTWQEFGERFNRGSSKAYHALLFVFLRRTTPGLKYDAVQFGMDEIDVDYDNEELQQLHDAMAEHLDELDGDELDMLASLKDELEERGIVTAPVVAPKALSDDSAASDTSGTSPTSSTSTPEPSTA